MRKGKGGAGRGVRMALREVAEVLQDRARRSVVNHITGGKDVVDYLRNMAMRIAARLRAAPKVEATAAAASAAAAPKSGDVSSPAVVVIVFAACLLLVYVASGDGTDELPPRETWASKLRSYLARVQALAQSKPKSKPS
ncbi:hypothetical protein ACP70R_020735 [Stipagrostis hirtigluma subsp. patula]